MNLKMQEYNHHTIAFHSSRNVFKVTLKWWCISKTWCFTPHSMNFYRKPVTILGKNGTGKRGTLVLNFFKPKPPNPPS